MFLLSVICVSFSSSQFRAEKGSLPEAGDMEQAEAVYDLAKAVNADAAEDGGFSAEGLEDSKVGRMRYFILYSKCIGGYAAGKLLPALCQRSTHVSILDMYVNFFHLWERRSRGALPCLALPCLALTHEVFVT